MNNTTQSKRVFAGIKLSDEIAEQCTKLQAEIGDLPARFIPPEDMHLTLLPPIMMTDDAYVIGRIREVLQSAKRFTLTLERLTYGPNMMHPTLLWIECAVVPEIVALKKALAYAFSDNDHLPFIPHITLARLKEEDTAMLARRPVERPLKLSMPVESIELFLSPNQGGVGYTVLESLPIPLHNMPG
ncbi:MAG: hypothetical protein A2408_00935 [Candidatus Yonathbacteria bacterium RIFOXYC1_FULL_52_10]|uniref:RNA 2',3'-cyclic phosphodiesterase n=1 Tax=Candidatus Yonathbacteria bacterium RIFOXYD1_FULL_52_36 TaxID=1802730 RepID=A0A1G2SNT3_9BACT|nr:MAG: hypothetical protein A2408_00935 [Candidatus Yonathbacteria bacterium RIFOXYC1_FULL_52_10]OHA86358.1 MAG: hypothetical protein A2591_02565 [Candidatus Yonathbacteria bacterium RIFOXYD1_FULL_52_36]